MTHSGPDGAPSWSDWQSEDDPREAEAEPGPIYLILASGRAAAVPAG